MRACLKSISRISRISRIFLLSVSLWTLWNFFLFSCILRLQKWLHGQENTCFNPNVLSEEKLLMSPQPHEYKFSLHSSLCTGGCWRRRECGHRSSAGGCGYQSVFHWLDIKQYLSGWLRVSSHIMGCTSLPIT